MLTITHILPFVSIACAYWKPTRNPASLMRGAHESWPARARLPRQLESLIKPGFGWYWWWFWYFCRCFVSPPRAAAWLRAR